MRGGFLALLMGLVAASPAQAELVAADGQPLPSAVVRAAAIADAHFPAARSNCPTVTIAFTDEAEGLGQRWVSWAHADTCKVGLRPWFRETPLRALCSTVVHEWGHLANLTFPDNPDEPWHSKDPGNVMFPGVPTPPPGCAAVNAAVNSAGLREQQIYSWLKGNWTRLDRARRGCKKRFGRPSRAKRCYLAAKRRVDRRGQRLRDEWDTLVIQLRDLGETPYRDLL